MNRIILIVIACAVTMWLNSGLVAAEAAQSPSIKRKVLLFLIDGVTPGQLQKAKTPSMDQLAKAGVYSPLVQTVSKTSSAPGHSDIVTGVGAPKHGAINNTLKPSILRYDKYPDFLTRLESEKPALRTVALMSWTDWYDHIISQKIDQHVNYDRGTAKHYTVVDNILHLMAIDEIQYKEADAIYVEFGNTDAVAHANSTFAQKTLDEVETVDRYIGAIWASIQARSTFTQEHWLVMVSTDHGRREDGGHGGTSPEERQVFMLAWDSQNKLTKFNSESLTNNDFAPTLLNFMLGEVKAEWDLDGHVVLP